MTLRGTIPFLCGLAIALGAGWVAFPHVIYRSQPQPVNFSHKVHADKAGTKCEDCHSFRDDGTFAGDKRSLCRILAGPDGHRRSGELQLRCTFGFRDRPGDEADERDHRLDR